MSNAPSSVPGSTGDPLAKALEGAASERDASDALQDDIGRMFTDSPEAAEAAQPADAEAAVVITREDIYRMPSAGGRQSRAAFADRALPGRAVDMARRADPKGVYRS